MNYREFTERVYNYKHGLTNSAESQTNNENIEHSAKGDEWNQHKYKEKIYLGNGTFRYVYDDGTESTGTKPLEYDDPGRQSQRAKPLVDNFNGRQTTKEQAQGISNAINTNNQISQGKANEAKIIEAGTKSDQGSKALYQEGDLTERSIVVAASQPNADVYSIAVRYKTSPAMIYDILSRRNSSAITPSIEAAKDDTKVYTSYPSDAGTQSPSNPDFLQARNDSYSSESSKPVPYAQQDKEIAAGKAQEEARKAAGNISPTYRTGEDLPWQKIQGTKAETERKLASNIDKEPIITPALEKAIADTAVRNQAATASGIAAERAAAGTPSGETPDNLHRAMTETEIRNNGAPQGTPYNDLQNQSVNTTKDLSAQKALVDYQEQLRDIYYDLNQAGFDDATIINFIRSSENRFGGESIMDQLNAFDPEKQQIIFFPGAEEGIRSYMNTVIPQLKSSAANLIDAKKTEDIKAKLTPEEYEFITKNKLTI